MIQFGPIVHEIYQKIAVNEPKSTNTQIAKMYEESKTNQKEPLATGETAEKIQDIINKACLIFYDTKMIFGN